MGPVAVLIKAVQLLRLLVVADALFSFALAPNRFPRSLTKPLLDPVYNPIRALIGRFTPGFDLSPLLALLVLYVVQVWLERRRAAAAGGAG